MTAYVTEVCRECGNLRAICSDPNVTWYPQRSTCYAVATVESVRRRTVQKYGHPKHDDGGLHITDGLTWWTSQHDLTPEDDFFGDEALRAAGMPTAHSQPDQQ